MDQNQENKLESIEKVIRKTYEEKKIGENNALDFIQALNHFLGDQPPNIKNLSAYKLMDDLIALLPSSREKFDTRIENLKIIMEFEPKNKKVSYMLAELYELLWDNVNAIEYLQKSYELDPKPDFLYRIGMRHRLLNNNKLAIEYFKNCVEQGYKGSNVFQQLGEAYFSIGEYQNAQSNLIKSLETGLSSGEDESKVKESLSILYEINSTTAYLNMCIRHKDSKPIKPIYSSSDKAKFISYTGQEFSIWRFISEVEGTEVISVNDNNSNAINFLLKEENKKIILLGIVYSHQNSPNNIQYFINLNPFRFEELDSNKMIKRANSDIMDPQKREIDMTFALEEYIKLIKNFEKSAIEIIPDLVNDISDAYFYG